MCYNYLTLNLYIMMVRSVLAVLNEVVFVIPWKLGSRQFVGALGLSDGWQAAQEVLVAQ